MTPALEELRITPYEIERLSGLEVSDHILNGFLWGTYRLPLRSPQRLLAVATTEPLVLGLMLIFAIPIGLAFSRGSTSDRNVLVVMGAIATCLWILRQLRMRYQARQLRSFMRLLDEVDRYHQVLEAVELFGQLGTVDDLQVPTNVPILEGLNKARESLIAGLMTEKILRQNRGLLSRRQTLLENIEQNLVTLQSLELQHQTQDYSDILDQALDISLCVQNEVTQVSRVRSPR